MPYLELAEAMGKIFIQAERAFANKIEIIYSGQIDPKMTTWLTRALLKGYLEFSVQDTVNYVNSQVLATEQGIEVIESKNKKVENLRI